MRKFHAPSLLGSQNFDPEVPASDKLKEIASAAVLIEPIEFSEVAPQFSASLPYTAQSFFGIRAGEVYATNIDLGDEELCGKGIGTRIVQAATRYAVEHRLRATRFTTHHAHLGMLRTAEKVFGEENVAVEMCGQRYGRESGRLLDAVFDDFIPVEGEPYVVHGIEAHIAAELVPTWESPIIN